MNRFSILKAILPKLSEWMEEAQKNFLTGEGKIKKKWVLDKLSKAIDIGSFALPIKPFKPVALLLASFAIDGLKAGLNFVDTIQESLPDDYIELDVKEKSHED